jgi:thiol-disulfide isomerase/thioredoxin
MSLSLSVAFSLGRLTPACHPAMIFRIAFSLVLACLLCAGCSGDSHSHPAIGRVVGRLPLVAIADPSRPPPTFTGRVTLLNFWGTWCGPCRRELPGMARIAGRLADEPAFQLVAVSCGSGGPDEITEITDNTRAYLSGQKLAIDAWADPSGMARLIASESFGFSAYPTTYLIGTDARVQTVWVGYRSRDEADMARAIVAALKTVPDATAPVTPGERSAR